MTDTVPAQEQTFYNYGFIEENMKKAIRRSIVKAICVPGNQVPYASREMPIARGYGTGGLQISLSLVGPGDVLKVFDEGSDDTVNAVNMKRFIQSMTNVAVTEDATAATIIQSRHRIPEEELTEDQIVVLQAAYPDPLRAFEPFEAKSRKLHGQKNYSKLWLLLYESIVAFGAIMIGGRYPLMVNGRYAIDPTHIPRWDIKKLNMSPALFLWGAGREKRIYAVPPYTSVEPLEFDDYKFKEENFAGKACALCGSEASFLTEVVLDAAGKGIWVCADTAFCEKRRNENSGVKR
ncbi:MAG TPA: alpha-D-ribose 1-methylphosphonate 5-phosphate C-P-lyase PhnJ [Negativicutes bacterium]|nr:alpha-D-ribose 1-methylphosphonate 5-phosphate C-P-lyase PhnJ [Negativicutes bacterium]